MAQTVWRVVAEIPTDRKPNWSILGEPQYIEYGCGTVYERGWPRARMYLTAGPAKNLAERLNKLGAKAHVVQSLPIQWPDSGAA